jgi:putative oligomerization/nucleic acid binding protein
MRYLVRMSAGLALLAAGLTAVEYALYHLVQAGTCITRGDFLTDNAGCITDSGSWAELLPPGGVVALVGTALFAARGAPPDAPASVRRLSAGVVAWSAGLAASGATMIYAVTGPDSMTKASARGGAIAGGCALIAIGLLPLLRELFLMARARTTAEAEALAPSTSYDRPWTPTPAPQQSWTPTPPPARPPTASPPPAAPAPAPSGGSAIERLNALARQRDSGAISTEEFERLKAEVLSDMTRGL